jgi:hypothetical protein
MKGEIPNIGDLGGDLMDKAKEKSGGFVVIPVDPGASEMIRRITSDDPDDLMPQPDHGPTSPTKKWNSSDRGLPKATSPLCSSRASAWPPRSSPPESS